MLDRGERQAVARVSRIERILGSHEVRFSAWPRPDFSCLALNEWTNLADFIFLVLKWRRSHVDAVRGCCGDLPPLSSRGTQARPCHGAARLRSPAPEAGVSRLAGLSGADGRGEPTPVLRTRPWHGLRGLLADTRLELHT